MDKRTIKKEIKLIEKRLKEQQNAIKDRVEKIIFKEKKYVTFDAIYEKYGQEVYKKCVPKKYRDKDVKNLLEEGRYVALYEKHGEKTVKSKMKKIRSKDIQYESGSEFKSFFYRLKYNIKHIFLPATVTVALIPPTALATFSEDKKAHEEEKYSKEITNYLDEINEYANGVKKYELTDLQNIMKVMDDMWKNSRGYGEPEMDLTACSGMDMGSDYGVGVCRNMADDFARKLNIINSEYNARSITVFVGNGTYQAANVRCVYNEEPEEQSAEPEEELAEQEEESGSFEITKLLGNHAIVLMNIPNENITLAVDPTNPGIGVFQNGKIEMFNSGKENGIDFDIKPLGWSMFGIKSFIETPKVIADSIGFKKLEELKKKYGLQAQNKALEEVRSLKKVGFREELYYQVDPENLDKEIDIRTEPKEIEQEEQNR